MESLLLDILDELRKAASEHSESGCSTSGRSGSERSGPRHSAAGQPLDDKLLAKIIHRHNRGLGKGEPHFSKKRLLPFYLKVKDSDPARWSRWNIDQTLEGQLVQTLRVKPRRTASGVATITVITKPWKCSSDCLYCPNDLRMPKSYLSREPACQRAERNYFDPYLQVASRLRALTHMGHPTDKIELIVLGGTWSDYPQGYQRWFISELFRALGSGDALEKSAKERRAFYKNCGLSNKEEALASYVRKKQNEINRGVMSYNKAMIELYETSTEWKRVAEKQVADFEQLYEQHRINETARHRVVGLVIETRPDTITVENLTLLRQLGCTKIQMGIQSLDPALLASNRRAISLEKIAESFALLRAFGFKIHAHFMINLYGATPENDKRDYLRFVTDKNFRPDEVKLYPCALVAGTGLCAHFADKSWRAYTQEELIDVLETDTLNTPPFIRISRMIRDISADDILAGNKKTNLRQVVEQSIEERGHKIAEIRYREISTTDAALDKLSLRELRYETGGSTEVFLQWVTPDNRIVGFLRLSFPHADFLNKYPSELPVREDEAMIREVHVYGRAAKLNMREGGAQHLGLGKQLIEAACTLASAAGYTKLNVISSVGTREYYRSLRFVDGDLYQQKEL